MELPLDTTNSLFNIIPPPPISEDSFAAESMLYLDIDDDEQDIDLDNEFNLMLSDLETYAGKANDEDGVDGKRGDAYVVTDSSDTFVGPSSEENNNVSNPAASDCEKEFNNIFENNCDTLSVDSGLHNVPSEYELSNNDPKGKLCFEKGAAHQKDHDVEALQDVSKVTISTFDFVFYPTKIINGIVSFNEDYDITPLCLSLMCEGTQSIQWKSEEQESAYQDGKTHFTSQTFFSDYVDLIHTDSIDGTYVFAFSYQIPPNLPSSFLLTGADDMDIIGVIEYTFFLLDIKENHMIAKHKINLYEAPLYHYIPVPQSAIFKSYYLKCIWDGQIELTAETNKGCYYFGDIAHIHCSFRNTSSEKIPSIRVQLQRLLVFKDDNFNERKLDKMIDEQEFQYVLEGDRKAYQTILNFDLKGADTQHVTCSRYISCRYILRVYPTIKSKDEFSVDLDVALYNRNLPNSKIHETNPEDVTQIEHELENGLKRSVSSSSTIHQTST